MKTFPIFEFDRQLIASLPSNGPRYTSYPTADRFHQGFRQPEYVANLDKVLSQDKQPVSLYIHIPFCNTICFYCGCNKVATKDKAKADEYLAYLEKELVLLKPHLHGKHPLAQLHFGGGTPTFLTNHQLERVFQMIGEHFELMDDGEYSIEIDPRKVSRDDVFQLAKLGFNRMSVGIQDFDPKVQKAVNRVQSYEETKTVIDAAREAGFKSVSVDLIYGLPHKVLNQLCKPCYHLIQTVWRCITTHICPIFLNHNAVLIPKPYPVAKKNWIFCNTPCNFLMIKVMCSLVWITLPSQKMN